ncbi:hypothetical protein [Collimonas fungivorans]|uniref:Uncharacterized protein n=1 Tax=Collimonas fungivorans (strain Ter331) TaxID=1005048 RepID=G0A9G9_COLFT|nr:hypothetical protein [Collimonas fungivorans]AEK62592.1 hypothetical protein CFU_2765 [Collimonas fungivorans Ter331]
MINERDLIADLTLAVIDLAGALAQIAETMPEHAKAQINDSLNVAVTKLEQVALAISAGDGADEAATAAETGCVAEAAS